jgi:hypothetical protein
MMCSEPGFPTGDGHLCATHGGRPPSGTPADGGPLPGSVAAAAPGWWQALTWGLVAVALGYVGLIGVRIWALAHEDGIVDQLAADPRSIDPVALERFLTFVASVDHYYSALLFVYLVFFLAWIVTVHRVVTRLGHDRRAVLRHWTFIVWRVTMVPVVLLAVAIRPGAVPDVEDRAAFRDAVVGINQNQIVYSVVRLASLFLFLAAVIVIWNRVRRPAPAIV